MLFWIVVLVLVSIITVMGLALYVEIRNFFAWIKLRKSLKKTFDNLGKVRGDLDKLISDIRKSHDKK